MIHYRKNSDCIQCNSKIDLRVFNYSIENYRHPLCRSCQEWFEDILEYSTATDEAIDLYFALRQREVPAKLEKSDGFKTIDIAIPHAKVNIEVDGGHHNYSARQAMSDLKRILHSFKKGYYTLHIPNSLVKYNIDEAADLITEFLIESRNQIKPRQY